jgi:ABC-type multidrug transport system fused ATPase/permease subunit
MSTKLNPSKLGTYGSIEVRNEQEVTNPLLRARLPDCYESASWWSQLTFNWLSPVLEIGNVKGRLDVEDLKTLPLPQDDTTSHVMEQFRQSWEAEKVRAMAMNKDPKVVRALWNAYYLDFCKAGFLKLVHDLLQFVGPQVLYHLIEFLRTPGSPMWYGLSLTLGVTAAQLLMSLTLRHYFFVCYRVGLRLRTAVIMAVYQKALVLADSRKSVGEITNLMSVDAQRLQDMISYLHSVWYSFLQIGLAIFFLWQQLGVSILAGVLVIILSIPLTAVTANMMGKLQKELMTSKDKRIEVNNEVLGQMRVVKLQAWEKPFQEKLEALRGVELTKLLHYLIGRMLTFLTWSAVPLTISITTFGTYAILGNKLDVASALTALALFEILRFPLFMLPSTINSMVEANVALNRINNFLTSPEHKAVTPGSQHDVGAEIVDGSFVYENKRPETSTQHGNLQFARSLSDAEWEMELLREQLAHAERKLASVEGRVAPPAFGGSNLLSLSRINLTVKKGEFVAIVGGVGCGKSSLLKALMGEIRKLSGDVSVCGSVSYSAQTAFIMNDTVKNNILFGKPDNNPELYNKAIRVCALEHDLDLLPHGDQTEIGEKGITLSGGQKTRIGMARALYHDADLFLLDDPLAAVDAHVGRQLFDQCIVDSMLSNDRSVVLVTNALQFLSHPRVDRIVVLKDGESIESGSFNELNSNSSSQFRRLLDSLNESRTKRVDSREDLGDEPGTTKTKTKGSNPGDGLADQKKEKDRSPKEKAPLMKEEERETGVVSRKVYMSWARAAGGLWIILFVLILYALAEGTKLLSNWWLTFWSEHGNETANSQMRFLGVYAFINIVAILFNVSSSVVMMLVALRASRALFSRLLDAVLRAPMSFFDTTPLGRIINRFSKGL